MTIWVGIDEAGYGPTLGPLCIGLLALQAGDSTPDLWKSLPSVTQDTALWRRKLALADSKELYKGPLALERLETSAMALAGEVTTASAWIELLGGWSLDELGQYPWHREAQKIPLKATLHREHHLSWVNDLKSAGIGSKMVWARPVMVRRFNSMLKDGNKSHLEFSVIMDMLERVLAEAGGETVSVTCDKLGGRDRYSEIIASRFPMEEVRILTEHRRESRYEVPSKGLFLTFKMGADRDNALVASASILAKYTREILMHQFNQYWRGKVPGLEPTAGYPEDAKRFLAAVLPTLDAMGFSRSWMIREK